MLRKVLLFLFIIIFLNSVIVANDSGLKIFLNNRKIIFEDNKAVIDKEASRVLVPIDFINYSLEQKVEIKKDGSINIEGDKKIKLYIGKKNAIVDSSKIELDTFTKKINSILYVPLRFIAENLGFKVEWDQENYAVKLYSNVIETSASIIDEAESKIESNIVNLNEKYTYDQMVKDINLLEDMYPEIIKTEIIGKTEDNRDIWLVKLGKGDAKIVLEGGNHAREYASTPILMKCIEEYANHYMYRKFYYEQKTEKKYNINEILNKSTFYIVPMLNADGVTLATEGIEKIENDELRSKLLKIVKGNKKIFKQWKANARGVDLNRNYPCDTWGIINTKRTPYYRTKPAPYYFKGYESNSESEIKAMTKFLTYNDFMITAAYHSRGQIIYWHRPYEDEEFNDLSKSIMKKLIKVTEYKPVPAQKPILDGSTGQYTDFISQYFHKPCFTIETLPIETTFPVKQSLVKKAYDKVKTTPLILAEEAIKLYEINYYPYRVYQNNVFLHTFRTKEDALSFAKRYSNTVILLDNKIIWNNFKDKSTEEIYSILKN